MTRLIEVSGRMVYICDVCNATFEPTAPDSLEAAWREAQQRGWRIAKRYVWSTIEHTCPECSPKD